MQAIRQKTNFAVDSAMVGMALFLMTEVMLFAGLISAVLVTRSGASTWPPAGLPRLPVLVTAINTAVLLASGIILLTAGGRRRRVALAAILGGMFLAIQGFEWAKLITFGLTAGSSNFGGLFYALIGMHALHVLAGLVCLLYALSTHPKTLPLRVSSLYWYFVVAIWPALYISVYL